MAMTLTAETEQRLKRYCDETGSVETDLLSRIVSDWLDENARPTATTAHRNAGGNQSAGVPTQTPDPQQVQYPGYFKEDGGL